jgi:hypothetical protein
MIVPANTSRINPGKFRALIKVLSESNRSPKYRRFLPIGTGTGTARAAVFSGTIAVKVFQATSVNDLNWAIDSVSAASFKMTATDTRKILERLAFFAALAGLSAYFRYSQKPSVQNTAPAYSEPNITPEHGTFAGYRCTVDCSGHEAGYRWAEEHDINDGDECDTAGETSNSPSFAEGCHAYVEGEVEPKDDDDSEGVYDGDSESDN